MKIKKNGKIINLTESDLKRIVKRVISEQEVEYKLETIAGNYADNYQSEQLSDKVESQYAAFGDMGVGGKYKVFVTDKTIIGNNGKSTIVLGKSGVLTGSLLKNEWSFSEDERGTIATLKPGITDLKLGDEESFAGEVRKSLTGMANPVNLNSKSIYFNKAILGMFVTGKIDYNWRWNSVEGYNEKKYGAVTQAAANFINLANKTGITQGDTVTKESLSKIA